VLFESRDKLAEDTMVPVKIISTTSDEITGAIITATNRQTPVTTEDLYALNEIQKSLSSSTIPTPGKEAILWRRSKQYAAVDGIEKVRIITKQQQVRAFGAMFLDDAHSAARYYSDLTAQVGTKIFNSAHQLEPYYTAAYAYYKLEYLFRNGALPVYYKPARYHLLMAVRYLIGGPDMPQFTANRIQGYCNKICEVLWSDEDSVKAFHRAIETVDSAPRW
jgi:hypothetical protein